MGEGTTTGTLYSFSETGWGEFQLSTSFCQNTWFSPPASLKCCKCVAEMAHPSSMYGPNFCRAATDAVLEIQLLTTLPSGFHSSPFSIAHRSHSQLLFLGDASCLFMLLTIHYVCLSADRGMVSILTDIFHKCLKSTHTNVKEKKEILLVLDSGYLLFAAEGVKGMRFPR